MNASRRSVQELLHNKKESALGIWLVSNCKSTFRNEIMKDLQRFLKIDVKGKCSDSELCRGECGKAAINR